VKVGASQVPNRIILFLDTFSKYAKIILRIILFGSLGSRLVSWLPYLIST
jgi:hypothetical protein